ncbi:hypothetical protein JTE90_005808 [Oedothorax gibbosus]|uniref:Uncharacterized protein n=1 Tax=Oedothorax gibbosus TaxID=931172 RepID=A0AAV6V419_9ARAC|nr:hypothetical protein JTE90_005808 [Oedothorax gibbosus]
MNSLLQALKFGKTSGNVVFKRSLCCLSKNQQITFSPTFRVSYTPVLSCNRNFWETFPYTRPGPHLKDGLDKESHEIVYRCKLFNYAFYAQLGSLETNKFTI